MNKATVIPSTIHKSLAGKAKIMAVEQISRFVVGTGRSVTNRLGRNHS